MSWAEKDLRKIKYAHGKVNLVKLSREKGKSNRKFKKCFSHDTIMLICQSRQIEYIFLEETFIV